MAKFKVLDSVEVIADNGYLTLTLKESLDGMFDLAINEFNGPKLRIGIPSEDGKLITFKPWKEIVEKLRRKELKSYGDGT